ncbi:YheC/YheD family endospore coat-associated protein [Paenibacillus segetis]|uniref:YheC/D like ATP-grasp n=1 Tax=Paenibacillus segetis TaxID=1325360 RepID=A0ABQ1YRV3_9BACL|nr:YheC/YheD family protein [Paenibacillus segetis]GGH34143.1 hypothetical protein GCM10008013_39690 [Paenibacillus segetis]
MGQDQVGILLNTSMYRGIPQRRTGQESISNYEEAAKLYGIMPCFLRLGDIDVKKGVSTAYIFNGRDYVRTVIPTPSVIHNRALYADRAAHKKIRSMISQGKILFNVNNRYSKDVIHRLLSSNPHLCNYLPNTASVSPSSLRMMMNRYSDLILKPIRGSVGHGILRLQRDKEGWKITFPSRSGKGKRGWNTVRLKRGELPNWTWRLLMHVPYLVQERIPLAEFENRPLDIRVTVQRGLHGLWAVTGLFAKVAPQGSFISNIAKGGCAYPVETVLPKIFPPHDVRSIVAHVKTLALTVAAHLSSQFPLLGDLGMDIGLTMDGRPYFIECNGRDQRYGFRKAGLDELWKDSYRKPMSFAWYLLNSPNLAGLPEHIANPYHTRNEIN